MCTVSDGAPARIWPAIAIAVVDRYRETLAAGGEPIVHRRRGGHTDHLSGAVHQRAAGVAGPDVGGDLDQPVQLLGAARQRVLRR